MEDLISRQAATSIPILPKEHRKAFRNEDDAFETGWIEALACVNELPSVCSDLSDYCDRLWKLAYERGKAEAEPKTGEWIHDGYDFPHGNDWIHCSVCGKRGINVPADLTNFCPNCGARMLGEDGEA